MSLPNCIAEWEFSIQAAEADRLKNPTAMDTMHSRIRTGQGLKEIQSDMLRVDMINVPGMPDQLGYMDWILEGMNIEDEQYVS